MTRKKFLLTVSIGNCAVVFANIPKATTTETIKGRSRTSNNNSQESEPKCGLYLAPSTIPGAGLGIFAGDRGYKKRETVSLDDVIIPFIESEWNNERLDLHYPFLWDEYTWSGKNFNGMEAEGGDNDLIMVASLGVGAAANGYLTLVNVDDTPTKMSRGMKADSPGVGAISPYHGRSFFASERIPPGREIYLDYGVDYFDARTETYGFLPLPRTFKETDKFIRRYNNRKKGLQKNLKNDEIWKNMWGLFQDFATIWENSRVLNGLPENHTVVEDEKAFLRSGGSGKEHGKRSIRDISWLEEHGQCMDNIKSGQSTNPDAGRGAFANRFIPQGGLVAPAPLIHVPEPNYLKMFRPINDTKTSNKAMPDIDGPFSYQLLLNYCFGHEQSTLLLCPYGLLTGFINHSHENPNTMIVWSQETRHPEWREQPIYKWGSTSHTGLSIDFVALRDIEEDEEIFIDYGEAWEKAWQEHVRTFVPREGYEPAYEMNEKTDIVYRTVHDRPYEVDGIQLWCRGWYVKKFYPGGDKDYQCRILEKLGKDRYVVEMTIKFKGDWMSSQMPEMKDVILRDVPSDVFYFKDVPYMRDHQMFNAFRHAMMLPDEMFPDVWKDKPKSV